MTSGTGWPPDEPPSLQTKMSRLGTVDRLAVDLFNEIRALAESAGWDEAFENSVIETTTVDPTDLSEEAMDKFYDEVEDLRDAVMRRACRAMINSLENRYDKVSDFAQQVASEKAMQT